MKEGLVVVQELCAGIRAQMRLLLARWHWVLKGLYSHMMSFQVRIYMYVFTIDSSKQYASFKIVHEGVCNSIECQSF
jgi:hypothetical protein